MKGRTVYITDSERKALADAIEIYKDVLSRYDDADRELNNSEIENHIRDSFILVELQNLYIKSLV